MKYIFSFGLLALAAVVVIAEIITGSNSQRPSRPSPAPPKSKPVGVEVVNKDSNDGAGQMTLRLACNCDLNKANKAMELLNSQKEIQSWLAAFTGPKGTSPGSGGKPIAQVNEMLNRNVLSIELYEDMPERNLTFDFYEVNVNTGEVKARFHNKDGEFRP